MFSQFRLFVVAIVACTALAACDSGSDSEPIAGSYSATTFTVGSEDLLSQGGQLNMSLAESGTVIGLLVVPSAYTEDQQGDESSSLDGTYTVSGSTVSFSQQEDTFVRDATWTQTDGTLVGVFQSIRVELTRR